MTRQKREIMNKIEEANNFIEVDMELGCGFAPVGAYDEIYKFIYSLQEELAKLSHYNNVEEMLYDPRGYGYN